MRGFIIGVFLVGALMVATCGGSKSPTTPSTPQPTNVAGIWRGTQTLTSVTGGECVGSALQAAIGTTLAASQINVTFTQSGTSLTGVSNSPATGNNCTFQGAISGNRIELQWVSCSLSSLLLQCPTGAVRWVTTTTGTASLTVSGSTMTGTTAASNNVTTQGGSPVAILTTQSRVSLSR